jgi:hypothetical protein
LLDAMRALSEPREGAAQAEPSAPTRSVSTVGDPPVAGTTHGTVADLPLAAGDRRHASTAPRAPDTETGYPPVGLAPATTDLRCATASLSRLPAANAAGMGARLVRAWRALFSA